MRNSLIKLMALKPVSKKSYNKLEKMLNAKSAFVDVPVIINYPKNGGKNEGREIVFNGV